MTRPNFILFMTDQHRVDHLGCYGNQGFDVVCAGRSVIRLGDTAPLTERVA